MQVGTIVGKTTTRTFSFDAEDRIRRTDYVSVKDPEGNWILCGIDKITTDGERTRADAAVIGYRDSRGFLKGPSVPFSPGSPVFPAEVNLIKETIGLRETGAYIGLLDGYDLKVRLPIENLIKKHISVLAKTGTGKSYLTGVMMEELAENKIPVVIIDPHGEYFTLQKPNSKLAERKFMERFGVQAKAYREQVEMYGFRTGKEIKLNSRLSAEDIMHLLPAKLSSTNKALLFSSVRNLESREYSLTDVVDEISKSKSAAKWSLISSMESLTKSGIFSSKPTTPEELVRPGKLAIIDLKEAKPEIQQMVVMKLAEDLFAARKHDRIPPFLFVVEEAHNFCPERGFGEVASSKILRTIASEGRKFGMGLMVVSQRPARVDKNVLSQCNTQVILKVTNPNDLAAISESVEGMAAGIKEEIRDLPVGVAMVVGITDQPLMVDIRIRRSEHGGDNVKMQQRHLDQGEGPFVRMFPPKIQKDELLARYKGVDAIDLFRYPLWRVSGKDLRTVYVDAITGMLVRDNGGSLERVLPGKAIPRDNPLLRRDLMDSSATGLSAEPQFQEEPLSRLLQKLKVKPEKIELVFYPYWLVKKKGNKFLIDGLSERMDPEAMETIREKV